MKTIRYGLIACVLLLSTNAHAGSCQVSYKAKKEQIDRFLFRDVETLKYSSGTISGVGDTKEKCEANALQKIKQKGWTITYSAVKMN
ncbi:hypothetical protein [Leucothrix pacifica]|uniref:Uncharacterized protein n=1 Tax=Leucothrix pacifica TaxID=1247513 RepID=A0A317CRM1_9GAMM|nr:hypothetical protein [Leucothrix pacifica]PWQ99080.1 hypothetical protein DKW60_06470 [Leucothrix pacifica]